MKLQKYPSIEQFRTVVKKIKEKSYFVSVDENGDPIFDYTRPCPVLSFIGTTKLHGTNAGIGFDFKTGDWWCQSRGRVLTSIQDDNAGFYAFWVDRADNVRLLQSIEYSLTHYGSYDIECYKSVIVYGEWCGQGIQSGIAINKLPRMFVCFGIKLITNDEQHEWLPYETVKAIIGHDEDNRIFNIFTFGVNEITIDFNAPELSQNTLIELTNTVEHKCPVGAYFGIDGVGEGIVWHSITEPYVGSDFMFKVKGEKHSNSKVKTLASVDIETITNINILVDSILTGNRLKQGIEYLKEFGMDVDIKNTGAFIKWSVNDCLKEEKDTIDASGLDYKQVCNALSKKAKAWFFAEINK